MAMQVTGWSALGANPWAYPALEILHLLGLALLLGNLVLFELRVWGGAAALPLQPLARASLALAVAGFGLLAASGLLMFSSQPAELLANRAFVIKMGLILAAGINAAVFHARGSLSRLDAVARSQTAVSLGLWLGAVVCGRWIAYA